MTAVERAREEGRRAGLLEAASILKALEGTVTEGWHPIRALQHAHEKIATLAGPAQTRLDGGEEPATANAQEATARVLIVLQAHLQAREAFFKEERGVYQPPSAAAQEEARKEIRAALIRHHETNGDREKWRQESAVLAAGVGILYSAPHNGELDQQNHEKWKLHQPIPTGWLPKLYLELWRPWKLQKGKADPVPGFAERCFARRRESGGGK